MTKKESEKYQLSTILYMSCTGGSIYYNHTSRSQKQLIGLRDWMIETQ